MDFPESAGLTRRSGLLLILSVLAVGSAALLLLKPPSTSVTTDVGGEDYIDQCRSQGVPIPPDWGHPDWTYRGVLVPPNRPFAVIFGASGPEDAPGSTDEIFTFVSESPPGTCIGMNRDFKDRGDGVQEHADIVCLGTASSKACFWEHLNLPSDPIVPLTAFDGGADFLIPDPDHPNQPRQPCTDCHLGQNPFLIHPGTPLSNPDLGGIALDSEEWFDPIVLSDWPQNTGQLDTRGLCTVCHREGGPSGRFPRILGPKSQWCRNVLGPAVRLTMPPLPEFHPPGVANQSDFCTHANELMSACGMPPPVVELSSSRVNFGEVVIGDIRRQTFTVTNGGRDRMYVTVLPPVSGARFSWRPITNHLLLHGTSVEVGVEFAPLGTGPLEQSLLFVVHPDACPRSITLSGRGTEGEIP